MIKIIEAVVASVIVLSTLFFFFGSEPLKTNWGAALLKLKAQDTMIVLEKNETLNTIVINNKTEKIKTILEKVFQQRVVFSINVKGMPAPKISVYTPEESSKVRDILSPLEFKLGNKSTKFSIASDNYKRAKTVFILNKNKTQPYKDYIKNGGGLVIVDNMVNNTECGFVCDLLESFITGPNETYFTKQNKTSSPSFRIFNYFFHIPFQVTKGEFKFNITNINRDNVTLKNDEVIEIGGVYNYGKWNIKLYNTIENFSADIGVVNRDVVFPLQSGFNSAGYCITGNNGKCSAVGGKYGKGRFVWINNYERTGKEKINDQLVKASVLWASGEEYQLIPGEFKTTRLGNKYFSVPIFLNDINPYVMELNIGLVFI